MTWTIEQADALAFLTAQPENSVDLIFTSPPYEEARLYLENGVDMSISRKTNEWVDWLVEVWWAAQPVCKGLIAMVVAGQTRKFKWTAGPALLMAKLHEDGFNLRNPPIFHRVGIPGSGGPDWLRADYEWIVCTSRPGKLPWSDNTACGAPPKWALGGAMSHQTANGRVSDPWGKRGRGNNLAGRNKDGTKKLGTRATSGVRHKKYHQPNGTQEDQNYRPPAIANPGNIIEECSGIIECKVGGGLMGGDTYASQNEAPFPEKLAEFFILSFCPPGGTVCDPFSGSGTTAAVAKRNGRNFIGCDLRASQVELGRKRLAAETASLFTTTEANP